MNKRPPQPVLEQESKLVDLFLTDGEKIKKIYGLLAS